jgi:DNA-binding winged helix-turn-helix (wHTH) protein
MTMGSRSAADDVVRFGVFELNLLTGELRKSGVRLRLQEQPFRILALLLERPGDLVTRVELKSRIWPEAVFVDFERGLHRGVNKLRRALGDSAGSPRFVETLARRGYRFMAPVEGRPTAVSAEGMRLLFESRTIPLGEGENVLGRDKESAVWLDSSSASRHHARIVVQEGRAVIEDLGSKNGTWVAGRKVEGSVPLEDGDEIRVGALRLTFRRPETRGSVETT